jgi:hypothetical protein
MPTAKGYNSTSGRLETGQLGTTRSFIRRMEKSPSTAGLSSPRKVILSVHAHIKVQVPGISLSDFQKVSNPVSDLSLNVYSFFRMI